ncbi:Exonuclease [Leishmania donovani]|uniref:Exonuclease, putative n=1 Tax=Leishmania donovani TaxID=5661 RepID=A0A3S7X262_LEIDO|nr:hypothetical protein, conserved [Leishmania donovani]AYU80540.1 Exonuclease, putative [Leishmania donovani]CAJ1990524.1 Exonuclease [Leishmania donovani]CBZ35779.1 hypothetical protein, conserved [Leishmania donovani]VDZ46379.1 Exonuclease_putative/Pfam:PF00929 [Leishmania donovani]
MGRIRSLAKELRQLELQKQTASPPPPRAASGDDVLDDATRSATSSRKPEAPSCSSSPRVGDILTNAAHAATTAEAEAVPSSSPASSTGAAAEPQPTSAFPLPRLSSSSRDGAHDRSRNSLYSLGGSRFDILMGGSHGDGGACRKSQVRKATKACASGGGKNGAATTTATQEPQLRGDAEGSSLLENGEDGEAATNPAPPLGTSSGIPTRPPFKRLLAQPFSHVLVCDFEATCASGSVHYPHEIIEFPVVVLDTATLRIVAEFHRYVRPLRNPKLTAFCTELTGITQEMVDVADPLPTVVAQFQDWLKTEVYPLCRMWARHYGPNRLSHNLKSEQRRFVYDEHTDAAKANTSAEAMICMATDGPWDMRRFMHECSVLRDGVDFPPVCYRYINVRHSYSDHFKCRQAKLTHMLKKMSMSFEGRRHSGIDDTRNIARVLAELFARGYRVHHVSTIKYAHRGDAFLESDRAAQELLSEFGETDETHTSKHATVHKGGGRQRGVKRA